MGDLVLFNGVTRLNLPADRVLERLKLKLLADGPDA
jgi:hypothetical protein